MENFAKQNFDRGMLMIEKMQKLQTSVSKEEYEKVVAEHEEVLSSARDFISGIEGDYDTNWFLMFKDESSQSKTYFENLPEEQKDILCRALVAELFLG